MSGATSQRPNVLFIAVDDLRPELGAYGAKYIKSPNIDRLAATGVRFDHAYTQFAICGPSRASLLTGLRPRTLQIEDIDTFFRNTVPDAVTLPQAFKENGYVSAYLGKIFHPRQTDDDKSWSWGSAKIHPPHGQPPGEYLLPENREIVRKRSEEANAKYGKSQQAGMASGPAWEAADAEDNAYADGRTADAAVEALRKLKGKPFFLGVGFLKPHLPWVAPKKYFDLYDPAKMPLPPQKPPLDGPRIARHSSFELRTRAGVPTAGAFDPMMAREFMRAYAACVSFIDAQVGKVLDELDALGLSDNTIVVLWGDHGWHLGEYGIWGKATNYEIATRVPLIIRAPGKAGNGRACEAVVESLDVFPTLCQLAGVPAPRTLEGRSLVPLLNDPAATWTDVAYSEFPAPALREWAARPLSKAMRETYFGPLMAEVEAELKREHGSLYDRKHFEDHVKGYSVRTPDFRYTRWIDRSKPSAAPLAEELYDHRKDPGERVNVAANPEYAADKKKLAGLLSEILPKAEKHSAETGE